MEKNLTDLKRFSRDGHLPHVRYWAVIFVMLAAVLLAGCAGLKSSKNAISQGTADAAPETPDNPENAMLGNLQGTVEIKTGDGKWTPVESGKTLESGQQLRTGAFSNVTLAYADGSQTYLGADAEIAIDALDARTSGARVVQLTLVIGESRHTVVGSDDSGSRYDVHTPNGDGSATGSTFTVMVLPNRFTQFWVENGAVSVDNENVSVDVIGGHTTIIHEGQPPVEPMFRITGEGRVMHIEANGDSNTSRPLAALNQDWTRQNDKITLCHATASATNPYVEITVSVQSATHGHARHPGDIIPAPAEGCPDSAFTTTSSSRSWNIAGHTFLTGSNTVVFGHPQPGDWVTFEGHLKPDGSRGIDRIVLVNQNYENQFAFIGKVESISASALTVSSREARIDEMTAIEAGLAMGDNVQVVGFVAEDGIFWAARISRIDNGGSNFRFAGILTRIGRNAWVISGINVAVDENTVFDGDFEVGNPMLVAGVITENGTWLATSMNLVSPQEYHFEFVGRLESLSPWTVSGISFDTADRTEIDDDLSVGDQVRVTGTIAIDGTWIAERIEWLDTEHETSFAFFGPVLSIDPWNVRGVSLVVDERTDIEGEITPGEMVKVSGWILDDGSWLATEIKHTGLHFGQGCFFVTSVVRSVDQERIVLADGVTLTLAQSGGLVVTGDRIQEGSVVRYQYCVDQDGEGRVRSIFALSQLYRPVQVNEASGKVVICHFPPGNPENEHTIEVGEPAVPAHLAHGDSMGACPGS